MPRHFPPIPNFSHFLPSFGRQVQQYRTLRGLSVEQVAQAVGISPQALREIEQDQRPAPSKEIVLAMAQLFKLSKDERSTLLDTAEMHSTPLRALMGQGGLPAAHPTLAAAILAFLIADIRGYTHYTIEYGDEAAARLTQQFSALAHTAVEQEGGHVVEVRGDEVLAVFASARAALRAARVLQSRCGEVVTADESNPLCVGIGMDVGEAVPVDGGGYRGAALNRAARLCSLAGAGEVLVSPGIVYLAPQVDGVSYVSRGQEQLKGFDGPTAIVAAIPTPLIEGPVDAATGTGDDSDEGSEAD